MTSSTFIFDPYGPPGASGSALVAHPGAQVARPYFTMPEAADYCGFSAKTLHRAIAAGRLNGFRANRRGPWRFSQGQLDQFMHGEGAAAASSTKLQPAETRPAAKRVISERALRLIGRSPARPKGGA